MKSRSIPSYCNVPLPATRYDLRRNIDPVSYTHLDVYKRQVEERTAELAEEKKKSDDLLFNILPAETADELKRVGRTTPQKFESVTVLFTDFIGFTSKSSSMSPEEIVTTVDTYFSAFDTIVNKYKVEKIKTIGDAYMCVGGCLLYTS